MAVQRQNPLPKGRYWVDIVDTKHDPGARLYFASWLLRNSKSVKVVRVEHFDRLRHGADRDWYLFDVSAPVRWETDRGFGLPTIVKSGENPTAAPVLSAADTATTPAPTSLSDQFRDFLNDAKSVVLIIGLGILWSRSDR